ncbi:MAG: BatD family protein [Planctomycetota bacterium]
MHKAIVCLAALSVLFAGRAVLAQAASSGAFAYVEPDRAYIGSPVRYVIVLEDQSEADPPELELDWATAAYRGPNQFSSTSIEIVNGRRVRRSVSQLQLNYALTPSATGSFVVPAQTVTAGGQTFETNPVRVTILEPQSVSASMGGSIEIRLGDETAWVGESVRAEVVWTLPDVGGDIQSFEYAAAVPDGVQIEPRGSAVGRDRRNVREVTLWGRRMLGRVGAERGDDGVRRRTFVVEMDLIPERAGVIDLGPVDISFSVESERGRAERRLLQRGDQASLEVRALPLEGRPEAFDGLVGRFAIDAQADPADVNVGDPIEVLVTISGEEPMRGVRTAPDLAEQEGWSAFRLSPDGWRFEPGAGFGQRMFRTTVRASDASVTELPPIELGFFDPSTGRYGTARTRPIPLNVRAVREVTAADAVVASGGAAGAVGNGSVARSPLEDAGGGVWANDLGPGVLVSDSFVFEDAVRTPGFISALLVPPVVWLVVTLGRTAASRRDPEAARRNAAAWVGVRTLRRRGVGPGVRAFVGDRFGLVRSAVTAADVRGLAERLESDAGRELAGALARAEAAAVTGAVDDRAHAAEVERLIRAFARDAGKGGRW